MNALDKVKTPQPVWRKFNVSESVANEEVVWTNHEERHPVLGPDHSSSGCGNRLKNHERNKEKRYCVVHIVA